MGDDDNPSSSCQKVASAKKICTGLQSEDKRVRKQCYIEIETFLCDESVEFSCQELMNIFNETHMYILNGFRDKSEAVREQAISFINFLIINKLPLNDYYLTYVFPVLVERIGSVEIIEESEEVRLLLLQLFNAIIIKYSKTDQLKPFLNDSISILSEAVKDKYPAIKELACRCVTVLSEALPTDFHMQAESLVKPVLTCFGHQRYKVRVEAIKCTGDIVMHSSYKALDEVVGPMAERLFDQIPIVRRTVAQVAARWLLDYRDRYSFFHKILPLLLTGLNDEVPETREEAHRFWDKVGLQYQQENEKDLKEQMDFLIELPKYYPKFQRPNLGCRVLVQRHIGKIAPALATELQNWQPDIRVRCSQLLCSISLCAESGLTMHLQVLFPAMYSAARSDDDRVVVNIVQASELMGVFLPVETWTKLVLPIIEDGPHYGHLLVLCGLITGAPQEYIHKSLGEITAFLSADYICHSRKKRYQKEMVKCVQAISSKCTPNENPDVGYNLFKILVVMISLRDKDNQHIGIDMLDDLSKALGFNSTYQLWSQHTGKLLHEINVDPKSWTEVTPQRCILDTILLHSGGAFGENLEDIAKILSQALDTDADAEARLGTFLALSMAFEKKEIIFKNAKNLTGFLEQLIMGVFVPSLVWHAGLTAEAMRTMAASCLNSALSPSSGVDLFSNGEILRPLMEKLLPLLLSLVEDASYRSRQLAIRCIVLLKQIACNKNIWTLDDLVKVYPEIMKRLDDPTDKVRFCALELLPQLFVDSPPEFKQTTFRAHHELIIDTLMIHYDDHDEQVEKLIYDTLKVIAHINPEELSSKVQRHKPVIRNQKGCDMILEYLKEMKIS